MQKTVFITDGRYRSALAAVRMFAEAGYRVIVTQTENEARCRPAAFSSRFADRGIFIPGSVNDKDYSSRLFHCLSAVERPILFCVGAGTQAVVAREREAFRACADFVLADPRTLDRLNDKQIVSDCAAALGIRVPTAYTAQTAPGHYPLAIKPHCGEKFGLKAAERYRIATDDASFYAALSEMQRYDPEPIIQEKVTGDAIGVNLLLGKGGELLSAYCHRRIRQYPISGGPSTCCEAFYDEARIAASHRLLQSFGFSGIAMVEYKGDALLEVNPRVWGSFPLAARCKSDILAAYAKAACGETVTYRQENYRAGAKMRFLYHDTASALSLLRHGKISPAAAGLHDFFTVPEALWHSGDKRGFLAYLYTSLREHG